MLLALSMTVLLAADAPQQSPFPLPGQPPAVPVDRTRIRVETPFAEAARFYERVLGNARDIRMARDGESLTFTTSDPSRNWRTAVVSRAGNGVLVRVRPHFRLESIHVDGEPPPRIHIIIPRDPRATEATTTPRPLEQPHR